MQLVLIKEIKNSSGRTLKVGQVGEFHPTFAKKMIESGEAVEYKKALHHPFQKGAFVDLSKMENATKKTTTPKPKIKKKTFFKN